MISSQQVDRLCSALHLEYPLLALYHAEPGPEFEPLIYARGRACCFAYFKRWREGQTLVVEPARGEWGKTGTGCMGMQRAFGISEARTPWLAHFLTDGKGGAPMGEGLKATPELAQQWIDRGDSLRAQSRTALLGPLRPDRFDAAQSVTFFCDPDRLAALITLATYWSADPEEVVAPFSSGCGHFWRVLKTLGRDRALVGGTDVAMRKYLPPNLLSFTVSPERFERMAAFPDDAFLNKEWWKGLMAARGKK
jgi:hypothetical protein